MCNARRDVSQMRLFYISAVKELFCASCPTRADQISSIPVGPVGSSGDTVVPVEFELPAGPVERELGEKNTLSVRLLFFF